jgi:hypothetical protein
LMKSTLPTCRPGRTTVASQIACVPTRVSAHGPRHVVLRSSSRMPDRQPSGRPQARSPRIRYLV